MLTGLPLDALDFPVAAIELMAWLRAESAAMEAAVAEVDVLNAPAVVILLPPLAAGPVTVPAGALVDCVPLALPPEVLT